MTEGSQEIMGLFLRSKQASSTVICEYRPPLKKRQAVSFFLEQLICPMGPYFLKIAFRAFRLTAIVPFRHNARC